jgi:hypothetical protein
MHIKISVSVVVMERAATGVAAARYLGRSDAGHHADRRRDRLPPVLPA